MACSLVGRATPTPDALDGRTTTTPNDSASPVAPTSDQQIMADSFFFGYAFIDLNGNGQLDPDDPPLAGALFTAVDAQGVSSGALTDGEGHAMAWWPAGSQYPVTARMEPPKDSGYVIVGANEVVLELGKSSAEFLFTPPPASRPAGTPQGPAAQESPSPQLQLTPSPAATTGPTSTLAAAQLPAEATSETAAPGDPFHLVAAGDGLPPGDLRHLWADTEGRLWVAADAGIFVHAAGGWTQLASQPAERLLGADDDGRIWVIMTGEETIGAYDSTAGSWTIYGAEQGWTPVPRGEYLSPGYGDGLVTDLQGRIWLATGRNDLRRFDPGTQRWQSFNADDLNLEPPEEEVYQGHFLADVELSQSGTVWVGHCLGMGEILLGQGIAEFAGDGWRVLPETQGECVQDLEIDRSGRIWVGGFDALGQFDQTTNSWQHFPLPAWERRQLVTSISLDGQDRPWLEIVRYGGASPFGMVARYHLHDGEWVMDYEGWFSSLAFAEDGTSWLCSEGSVYRLENEETTFVGKIPSSSCQIAIDGDGRLWIAGDTGLWWFEP